MRGSYTQTGYNILTSLSTCVFCRQAMRDTVFLPCKCFIACRECAEQLDQCPNCLRTPTDRIQIRYDHMTVQRFLDNFQCTDCLMILPAIFTSNVLPTGLKCTHGDGPSPYKSWTHYLRPGRVPYIQPFSEGSQFPSVSETLRRSSTCSLPTIPVRATPPPPLPPFVPPRSTPVKDLLAISRYGPSSSDFIRALLRDTILKRAAPQPDETAVIQRPVGHNFLVDVTKASSSDVSSPPVKKPKLFSIREATTVYRPIAPNPNFNS